MPHLFSITIFLALGILFAAFALVLSRMLRPKTTSTPITPTPIKPHHQIPFSFNVFTIAMLFLIADIAISLLLPWATLFQIFDPVSRYLYRGPALIAGTIFLAFPAMGVAYLWKSGYLPTLRPKPKPQLPPLESSGPEPLQKTISRIPAFMPKS